MEPTPASTRGPLDTTTAPGPVDSGLGPADLGGADPGDPGGPTTGFDGDDRDGEKPPGKGRKPAWLVAVVFEADEQHTCPAEPGVCPVGPAAPRYP